MERISEVRSSPFDPKIWFAFEGYYLLESNSTEAAGGESNIMTALFQISLISEGAMAVR